MNSTVLQNKFKKSNKIINYVGRNIFERDNEKNVKCLTTKQNVCLWDICYVGENYVPSSVLTLIIKPTAIPIIPCTSNKRSNST